MFICLMIFSAYGCNNGDNTIVLIVTCGRHFLIDGIHLFIHMTLNITIVLLVIAKLY